MKLKILGTGSSGNCYVLNDKNNNLLLECGLPIKDILVGLNFNITNLDGILITHHHIDHSKSASDWQKRGIKTIRPFDGTHKNTMLKKGSCFQFKPIPLTDIQGNWTHTNGDGSPCPIYGYYIYHEQLGSLVYCTDTEFIKYRFKNVNHFLIEANYDLDTLENEDAKANRVFGSHQSIQAACKFIQANQSESLKNVILCHLSSDNGSPDKFKEMMQEVVGDNVNVYIAKKGLEIDL